MHLLTGRFFLPSFYITCLSSECACVLSHLVISDTVIPWTEAWEAPLLKEFSRQESWSRLPFPTPGDLPNPGIKPVTPACPALEGRFFFFFLITEPHGKPRHRNQWKHSFSVGTPSKSQPPTHFSLLFLKFRGTDIWLIFSCLSVTSGKNTKYDIHLEYW